MVDWQLTAFLVLSVLEIGGSIMVVASRKLVHAVFWVAMTLVTIGGVYPVLQAEVLVLIHIPVYAGAGPGPFPFRVLLPPGKRLEAVAPPGVPESPLPE